MSALTVFIAALLVQPAQKFIQKFIFNPSVSLTRRLPDGRLKSILLIELDPARRRAGTSVRREDVLVD